MCYKAEEAGILGDNYALIVECWGALPFGHYPWVFQPRLPSFGAVANCAE